MDLCLRYKDVTLGIELKVWREKKRDPQTEGIEQLESYLGRLGLDFGCLFVFDRRKNALPMEERLSTQVVVTENHTFLPSPTRKSSKLKVFANCQNHYVSLV